jgi:D-3-phosphoglycerate dehydrogenase
MDRLDELWGRAEIVALAAPVTAATYRMVNARTLAAMRRDAVIVNIARGALIHTDALVDALRNDRIGGAALDVTDPEPLPTGHPLWSDPRVLITPHSANPHAARHRRLSERISDNVARIMRGADPVAVVDLTRGY